MTEDRQRILNIQQKLEKGDIIVDQILDDDLNDIIELYDEQLQILEQLTAISKENIKKNISKLKKK